MSSPDYDPKAVALLEPSELESAREVGLTAFAAAVSLEALAAARTAHLGDRAPVSLANREIAVLPPAARGEAGKRVNAVRRALQEGFDARKEALEAERDARVLVEERVDVSLLPGVVPAAA
ncbi:MAG TPA: phenylalanine--tRNA ligase subunit alpha, partial [Mycobacteriales bacterium]|nr:phenylalanine--tRNA ligase subunit alpha [Mycobacteriales bacterium]